MVSRAIRRNRAGFDDGNLTDGQGNVINFKNTIIICTSNAGFGNAMTLKKKILCMK